MIVVAIAFYAMTFYKSLLIFFVGSLILGITKCWCKNFKNYISFNHIPNNLIGKATSVFSSLNILVRISLISILLYHFLTLKII